MGIVKSAQLPNVGCCEGGLLMATFERLEPYVGKPTSTVLMGLGSGNGPWLPDCRIDTDYHTRFLLVIIERRENISCPIPDRVSDCPSTSFCRGRHIFDLTGLMCHSVGGATAFTLGEVAENYSPRIYFPVD